MSSTRPTTTPTVKATASYSEDPHYQEAQIFGSRVAYIGSIQISPLKDMRTDVMLRGKESKHFGSFFCPERTGEWTYEKNQAFMAGAIDVGRKFILVTDISKGYNVDRAHYYGTVKELLWLKDNGYTFRPDPENMQRTIAEAPVKPLADRKIDSYQDANGVETGDQVKIIKSGLQEIKDEVAAKKEQILRNNESNRFQSSSAAVSTESLVPSSAPGKYIPPSQRGYTPGQLAVSRQSPLAATSSVSSTSSSTPTINNLQPSRVTGPPPGFTTPGPNTSLDARASSSTSSITARLTAASGSTIPRYAPPGKRLSAQTSSVTSSVSTTVNTPATISRCPIYVAPTPTPTPSAPSANPSTESTPSVTNTNTPNQPPPGLK